MTVMFDVFVVSVMLPEPDVAVIEGEEIVLPFEAILPACPVPAVKPPLNNLAS